MGVGATSLDLESLARLHERGVRDEEGVFLVEGVRFLVSACDTGAEVVGVAECRQLLRRGIGPLLVRRLRQRGTPVVAVSPEELSGLSILGEPQGVLAVVRQRWSALPPPAEVGGGVWLAFESVRSHGNLGTIVRTAQATGARGVILLGNEVDPFDPRAVRPTMGAIFHQTMIRSSHRAFARWKRSAGVTVIGTSAAGGSDYRDHRYRGPTVLMMGCERRGLSDAQRDHCDDVVRIPMRGGIDSLNLAVATGVLLYEVSAQRRPRARGRKRMRAARR